MRRISIEAFVISNVAWVVVAIAIFLASTLLTLLVAWGLNGFAADIKPTTDALWASSIFMSVIPAITVLPAAVIAGYLAGRIAKRGHALYGALSSCAWIAILIYVASGGGPSSKPSETDLPEAGHMMELVQLLLFPGSPVLGALGGLWTRHTEKRRADRGA